MKLYYSKGACSLAVRIALHEMNIPSDYESVDLKTKKTEKGTDYLQINPKGSVPALELAKGEVLTENAAIQQYLADQSKATSLLLLPPVSDKQRYRVIEMLNFVATDVHKSCGPLFNSQVPDSLKDEIFRPILKNKLSLLDQVLAKKQFLLGDHFTLPDGYLFVILRWLTALGLNIDDWKNLPRYFADLKKRKAIQQAMQEENLS